MQRLVMGMPVSRAKGGFSGFAVPKPNDVKMGIMTLLEEIRRVELHGFNPSELKTAKLKVLEGYESAYKEKDKTKSRVWADELIRHFLEKEPIPGIEYEYEFVNKHLEGVTLEEINSLIEGFITEENRVMYLTAPEQEGVVVPTAIGYSCLARGGGKRKDLVALANEEIDTKLDQKLKIVAW